jgi:Skp family chaperone for outer membrane proteins
VKRTVAFVAGLAAVGAGVVYLSSRLSAQAPPAGQPAAQAPATTRVAAVNTIHILKNYNKFKTFQTELKGIAAPYEAKDKEWKDGLKKYKDALEKNPQDPNRDKLENGIKQFQRAIEDNALEGRKALAKRSDEQLVQLFREIENAIGRYAAANGFHLVFQYDEPVVQAERESAQAIQRRMNGIAQTGCVGLTYSAPGLDITQSVLTNLNSAAPAGGNVTPVSGPGGQPGKQ